MLTFRGPFFPETVPPPQVHASLRVKVMMWPSLFCVNGCDECFWRGAVACVGVHDAEVWCSKMARMGVLQKNSAIRMLHGCCMLHAALLLPDLSGSWACSPYVDHRPPCGSQARKLIRRCDPPRISPSGWHLILVSVGRRIWNFSISV